MNNKENAVVSAMRAGFTLVELLVVVAILGILAAVATQTITGNIENAKKTAAKTAVDNIKGAVASYMLNISHKSTPPSDLTVLVTSDRDDREPVLDGGEGALVDPWDNDYKIEVKGKRYAIICAGPDGEFGTEDDIRSDKIDKKKE